MSFDWESYLSMTNSCGADPQSFTHVEQSLRSIISENTVCEIEYESGVYWFAHVKLICGQLLYISYLNPSIQFNPDPEYSWYNLSRAGIRRFGYAQTNLKPPSSSDSDSNLSPSYYKDLEKLGKERSWIFLEKDIEPTNSTAFGDHIKSGLRFELQDDKDPTQLWMVSVSENSGGLLGLSYTSPELKPRTDVRLFCLHPRLRPCGTVEQSQGTYEFKVPEKLKENGYPEPVWKLLKASFRDGRVINEDCIKLESRSPRSHSFLEKMLLAVIDPRTRNRFRVAIVEKVFDQFYFKISLLEESSTGLICSCETDEISSIPWAIKHGLLDKKSLQDMPCSPQSKIAPKPLFHNKPETTGSASFKVGDRFEYLSNPESLTFHLGVVLSVIEHILRIQVLDGSGTPNILVSQRNLNMFPVGWCQTNNIELTPPPLIPPPSPALPPSIPEIPEESSLPILPANQDLSSEPSAKPSLSGFWCPPIYFNHLCYSASFIRRPRLEALPRFIGPGPVRLVMREVISRLIASSFKSGSILKKLEVGEVRRPDYWSERMKGKSRVLLLQGEVEVPSKAEQVPGFCREICQKLECCPYLFGPVNVGGECPSACQSRPKHEFQMDRSRGSKRRKGKRKWKRAGEADTNGTEENRDESSSDDTSATPSYATTREPSRETSPDRDALTPLKRQRFCDENGTSLQLKVKPTLREMEEMEEFIEESLRESSPQPLRAPSPKLLRSRTSGGGQSATEPEPLSNLELEAAFAFADLPIPPPLMAEPPPVAKITLSSNPVLWTPRDVQEFISSQREVEIAALASVMKQEQIDGMAFLLLNLPTILDHWRVQFNTAYLLCRLVESVKLAFYVQYAHTGVGR